MTKNQAHEAIEAAPAVESFPFQAAAPGTPHIILPKIWNPTPAVNWTVLIHPALGPLLHALNWRRLGDRRRYATNLRWAMALLLGPLLLQAVAITFDFIPTSYRYLIAPGGPIVQWMAITAAYTALLASWYWIEARRQMRFVKHDLGGEYARRKWLWPILIGAAATAITYGTIAAILALRGPPAYEIRDVLSRAIPKQLKTQPSYAQFRFQRITLERSGWGNYTGIAHGIDPNGKVQLTLTAKTEGDEIRWNLTPIN
ncbi:MAG: hypothetical protein H6832_09410 [Planctomycetes bacterium]|nr:hypothetical protein [Planctomycetota bacterium]MCB9918608.1 hypothetical protein [Planctomycetota bacterium]